MIQQSQLSVAISQILCTAHDTPVMNTSTDTLIIFTSYGTPISVVSTPLLTRPTVASYSSPPISLTSVSYVYGSGPPPLIPRIMNTVSPASSSLTGTPKFNIAILINLNFRITTSTSLPGTPTINTMSSAPSLDVPPINAAPGSHNQSQQFAMCRLPKLTLPKLTGKPLQWLTFWDSFQAAIHLNPIV